MSKKIYIEASTTGNTKYDKRLNVSYLDENMAGGGTRICGLKYTHRSTQEILVPLTVKQAKETVRELQKLIKLSED